jgi:hypothetical protein
MNIIIVTPRLACRIRHAPSTHLFKVGHAVRLKGRPRVSATTGDLYRITKTLPPIDGSLQYRICGQSGGQERVTTEDKLEAVGVSI